MLLLLHISVHLTVMRFTMGLHSKISIFHLNKIRNSKTVDTHYSGFIVTQALGTPEVLVKYMFC